LSLWQWRAEEYVRTIDDNPWIPDDVVPRENARQRQFLTFSDVLEVFYGGSAGGGKTVATLLAAAQYLDVPGYAALLLRENFADLDQPKAWIPLSKSWWMGKADWNATSHRWTFPSGATVTFGHLNRDDAVYQYDTASYQFIAIDELTQHTEWRYRFLFGRIRRPKTGPLSEVPLRMRSASNPGNRGHGWVRKRFIDPKTREPGAVFVPAKLDDNAGNMDVESYRRDSLAKLDPLTRRQREDGDWDAVEGSKFKSEGLRWYTRRGDYLLINGRAFKPRECLVFQTMDPAASAKTTADHTVISTWCVSDRNELVWLGCNRFQKEQPDIIPILKSEYARWSPKFVGIEAVASNNGVFQHARREPMAVRPLSPLGKDKIVRATSAMILWADGRVWLPADDPTFPVDDVWAELQAFTGAEGGKDDIADTLFYASEILLEQPTGQMGADSLPRVVGG
jgi:hypothetical protein